MSLAFVTLLRHVYIRALLHDVESPGRARLLASYKLRELKLETEREYPVR
jgi:hypothetical protein